MRAEEIMVHRVQAFFESNGEKAAITQRPGDAHVGGACLQGVDPCLGAPWSESPFGHHPTEALMVSGAFSVLTVQCRQTSYMQFRWFHGYIVRL